MVYFALVVGICLCLVVFDVWFGCKVMVVCGFGLLALRCSGEFGFCFAVC